MEGKKDRRKEGKKERQAGSEKDVLSPLALLQDSSSFFTEPNIMDGMCSVVHQQCTSDLRWKHSNGGIGGGQEDGVRKANKNKNANTNKSIPSLTAFTLIALVVALLVKPLDGNPDAKRLYDDLMSSYNRLVRPVSNNSDTLTVKMSLKLSQLIEVVSGGVFLFLFLCIA